MDKSVEFMGFLGLFHRIHRILRKCIPQGGDKWHFWEIIPKSFEQGKRLHIFYEGLYSLLGLDGTTDIMDITLQQRITLETVFNLIDGIGNGAVVLAEELADGR